MMTGARGRRTGTGEGYEIERDGARVCPASRRLRGVPTGAHVSRRCVEGLLVAVLVVILVAVEGGRMGPVEARNIEVRVDAEHAWHVGHPCTAGWGGREKISIFGA